MTVMSADAPLLATKLFVPSPRQNRVGRDRLRSQLEAARGGTVTLAAAPAGSGKSTLLADWASTTSRRVAWLSLDNDDDDPRRFINYVIAALKNAGVISAADTFDGVTSSSPRAIEPAVTGLLNAIAERHAPSVLVLDDYHVIESESVHHVVQSIIDHIPPNLHLILASRVDPPLALSRLRARDLLLEIRGTDLRFSSDEAASFFNDAMGLSLTRDQVEELEERTEGWAVGLQMAAISLRGGGGAKFISSFSGSNRYVLDYLTEEVLQRQPEEIRSFLLETSILARLSAPLCDAVTTRGDSKRILEQLESANLFLIPLDDVRFWYRYHHLFGSLLQHELERSNNASEITELHRRASAWYAANRMPEPALHHAVAAGDDDRAIAIVSEHARPHITAGDGGTINRWISQLPRNRVENDFDMLMLHALALAAEYRLEEATRELDCAEQVIPPANRDHATGAVLSLRGMMERMFGHPDRSVETLERAMTLLDPNDFWYSMAAFHLGIAAFMVPDLRRAERYLEDATACHAHPEGLLTAVLGRAYGAWSVLTRGFPDEAARMVDEANGWIEAWAAKHDTARPLASLTYGVLADVHRLRNDTERACELARTAREFGKKGFFMGFVESSRALAQAAEAHGDWEAALTAAFEMGRALRWAGNVEGMGAMLAHEYRIRWRHGMVTGDRSDHDAVAQWCEENGFLYVDDWRSHMIAGLLTDYSLTIAARVLIDQKRFDEAQRLIDALLEVATRQERVYSQVTLLILRSLVDAALGRAESAVATMRRALDVAAKPRFIRLFLDEGSAVLPIVERAAPGSSDADFATCVLAAFDVPVKPRVASTLAEPLSDREIEVLQLIAAGASNQEAARKLFVAASTVKKHLEHIYAKLGVGGRTHAIARARELHIL